jgi:hypothetical protein
VCVYVCACVSLEKYNWSVNFTRFLYCFALSLHVYCPNERDNDVVHKRFILPIFDAGK